MLLPSPWGPSHGEIPMGSPQFFTAGPACASSGSSELRRCKLPRTHSAVKRLGGGAEAPDGPRAVPMPKIGGVGHEKRWSESYGFSTMEGNGFFVATVIDRDLRNVSKYKYPKFLDPKSWIGPIPAMGDGIEKPQNPKSLVG